MLKMLHFKRSLRPDFRDDKTCVRLPRGATLSLRNSDLQDSFYENSRLAIIVIIDPWVRGTATMSFSAAAQDAKGRQSAAAREIELQRGRSHLTFRRIKLWDGQLINFKDDRYLRLKWSMRVKPFRLSLTN